MSVNPGPTRSAGWGSSEPLLLAQREELRAFLERLIARSAVAPGGALDADDLLQDVMERALRYAHAFDTQRAVLPWLRRLAFRVFLDERQRCARRPRLLGGALPEQPGPRDSDGAEVVADQDEVLHQLAALSALERDLLCRFHRDGWTVREIAAALEMPEGTVKSHLHRARRRLVDRRAATEREERR